MARDLNPKFTLLRRRQTDTDDAEPITPLPERQCKRCGCTDSRACKGGCRWLCKSIDVCSKCVRIPRDRKLIKEAMNIEFIDDGITELMARITLIVDVDGGAR